MAREVLAGGCQGVAGGVEEAEACEDETCILFLVCPRICIILSKSPPLASFLCSACITAVLLWLHESNMCIGVNLHCLHCHVEGTLRFYLAYCPRNTLMCNKR